MKLEQELDSHFKDDRHKALVNIIYTANKLIAQNTQVFKNYDLTPAQFNVLRILRGCKHTPVSTKYIRQRLLDKMADASRLVDKLETKGLVKQVNCQEDRRLTDITITTAGLDKLTQIDAVFDTLVLDFDRLNPKELDTLNHLLDKLRG